MSTYYGTKEKSNTRVLLEVKTHFSRMFYIRWKRSGHLNIDSSIAWSKI